ncbi:hypothetical protein [Arthrobacter roseus]|uniref:hypothetical protein n=1 Tax=Arthrobacter roseus TaxID=136274 RepID=UPI001965A76B|nr:hypothetical protein [Arthrobacter roseus]MBM7848507.1 acyl-coenzyme A synthetase/AMP-(fatty) acid ligase [Arthrobacter roseus]
MSISDPVDFAITFTAAVSSGRCAAALDPEWPSLRREEALGRLKADVVLLSLKDSERQRGSQDLEDGLASKVFYLGFTSGSSSEPKIFMRDRGSW